ncbi:esterase/lipase family protein [Nocardia sp. NPDC059228]|uniref:esterase/lipase family protein n=1 Tax=Nocardia sp. NPDC059228 TaxID=3346777 RepID=UPI0036D1D273
MRTLAGILGTLAIMGSSVGAATAEPAGSTPLDTLEACPAASRADPPVLLIHGTHADVGTSLGPVRQALLDDGRCVYGLDYDSDESLPTSVDYFTAAVDRIIAVNQANSLDLVGKSQGALIARAVSLQFVGRAVNPVRTVVAVSGPQHGTSIAGIRLPALSSGSTVPQGLPFLSPAMFDMLAGSPYLAGLNSGPPVAPGVRYVMTATAYDEIVTPYATAFIDAPGVTNILVQDGCSEDHTGHLAGSTDPRTVDLVLHALDPDRHPTVRCVTNDNRK